MDSVDFDVVVVGDGPAGLALASACRGEGLRVVVVGPGRPWTATYGTWRDDVPDLPDAVFAAVAPHVVVHGHRRHDLARPYGVFDNAALREHLLPGVELVEATATGVQHFTWGSRVLSEVASVDGALVVDCTGSASPLGSPRRDVCAIAWQTALGVVLEAPPPGGRATGDPSIELRPGTCTLMDFRSPAGAGTSGPPTFVYSVPTGQGWLVEETVLAARHAVDPARLRQRLAARLGLDADELLAAARHVEEVRIPMGAPLPRSRGGVVPFGAAAGYVHPATGYSVAASLRAAPRVAAAIASGGDVWSAVWPAEHRRARRLQRYGLEVLLGLDPGDVGAFFDAFFDLPPDVWSSYLRVDTSPAAVARAMSGVFSAAPARVRRRLVVPRPAALTRLFRD